MPYFTLSKYRFLFFLGLSLSGLLLVTIMGACGEQSAPPPAVAVTPLLGQVKSTLTVFAIPPTFETKTLGTTPDTTLISPISTVSPSQPPQTQGINSLNSPPAATSSPGPAVNSSNNPPSPPASTTSPADQGGEQVKDYDSLLAYLLNNGLAVSATGEISQPFFTVKARGLSIKEGGGGGGGEIQVFEYSAADTASQEAVRVAANGSSIGTSMVSWLGDPHFYRKDRLLVLYLGSSPAVIKILTAGLGPQFAGK